MESFINLTHNATSYKNRVQYYILWFIGVILFIGIFLFLKNKTNISSFLLAFSVTFLLFFAIKFFKTKLYLADFMSDSEIVKIVYFNGSKQLDFETSFNNIEIELTNTSSKTGFDCEIILHVDELKLTINNDFDWNFFEMKTLFEYIKYHQKVSLTENEKFIISRIDNYLKKHPF